MRRSNDVLLGRLEVLLVLAVELSPRDLAIGSFLIARYASTAASFCARHIAEQVHVITGPNRAPDENIFARAERLISCTSDWSLSLEKAILCKAIMSDV